MPAVNNRKFNHLMELRLTVKNSDMGGHLRGSTDRKVILYCIFRVETILDMVLLARRGQLQRFSSFNDVSEE